MITDNLKRLNTLDIYSTILFVLFKTQNIPSQSTLSELVYILDKNSLLKLCEFYGGQTITIPTIEDLEILQSSFVKNDSDYRIRQSKNCCSGADRDLMNSQISL